VSRRSVLAFLSGYIQCVNTLNQHHLLWQG